MPPLFMAQLSFSRTFKEASYFNKKFHLLYFAAVFSEFMLTSFEEPSLFCFAKRKCSSLWVGVCVLQTAGTGSSGHGPTIQYRKRLTLIFFYCLVLE